MFNDLVLFKEKPKFFAIKSIVLGSEKAVLIKANNKEELRKKVNEAKKLDKIVVVESNKNTIRYAIEKLKGLIIVDSEASKDRDFMDYRNAGLNHVLCKLAKQNGHVISFNFNLVLNSEKKALILGRMMQNVKLCRKFKINMLIGSFAKNSYELRSKDALLNFGVCIGMHARDAKEALNRAKT